MCFSRRVRLLLIVIAADVSASAETRNPIYRIRRCCNATSEYSPIRSIGLTLWGIQLTKWNTSFQKHSFSSSGLREWGAYTEKTFSNRSPKTIFNTKILSLCLSTLTTLSAHFSATNIPTPSVFASFPIKNSLYLFLLSLTVKELWIGQYLVKLWARVMCLVFFDSRCSLMLKWPNVGNKWVLAETENLF